MPGCAEWFVPSTERRRARVTGSTKTAPSDSHAPNLKSGEVEVRVLLHDAAAPQAARMKLLALAQRLPSVFQFREVVDPAYREDRAAMVATDAGGYYARSQGDDVAGSACLDGRARVRQLQQRFEEICHRNRIERVPVDTSRDMAEVLVDYLNQRSALNRGR